MFFVSSFLFYNLTKKKQEAEVNLKLHMKRKETVIV